jgi:type IV pilus assembly protein PilW
MSLERIKLSTGFSLVEVMVSLVIGTVLVLGVTGIFLATQTANRVTNTFVDVQNSARVSFQLMSRDLRSAAFSGCGNKPEIVNVAVAANTLPPADWATWGSGILGYENNPPNIAGMAVTSGTDAVRMMYGAGQGVSITAHNTATSTFTTNDNPITNGINVGELMIVCDSNAQAAIFVATTVAGPPANQVEHLQSITTNISPNLGLPINSIATFGVGGMLMPLESVAWFVAENADRENSLYRSSVTGGVERAEEIVTGIENLQLEYEELLGINRPGVWRTANNVTNWGAVIAVRATITLDTGDVMSEQLGDINHVAANRQRMP